MSELTREQVVEHIVFLIGHGTPQIACREHGDAVCIHDATQRTHLATQGEEIKFWKETVGGETIVNQRLVIATLQAEFEGVRRERESYKAVLVGGEYEQVETIPTFPIEYCTYFGREVARRTKAIIAERDTLTQQLAEVTKERDQYLQASETWNRRYRDRAQEAEDERSRLGHDIVDLEGRLAARERQVKDLQEKVLRLEDDNLYNTNNRVG